MPSLVVTLATLYIIRGIDILIVGGKEVVAASLPGAFLQIPKATVFGIPDLAIVIAVGDRRRRVLPADRSGRAGTCTRSGPTRRRHGWPGYRSAGGCSPPSASAAASPGVAGVLWAAQYGTINSGAGTGYELQVVSAVVVGGVAIFGGSGTVVGAALGALLLSTISSALYVLGISPFWDQAIWGFLLILAIALDQTITERLTNALRTRRTRHE